jgi:hypothetical protein
MLHAQRIKDRILGPFTLDFGPKDYRSFFEDLVDLVKAHEALNRSFFLLGEILGSRLDDDPPRP